MLPDALLLTLLETPALKKSRVRCIADSAGPGQTRLSDLYELLKDAGGPVLDYSALNAAHTRALQILESTCKQGITLVSRYSALFPKNVVDIPSSPMLFYMKGQAALLQNTQAVAVVGKRDPSPLGAFRGSLLTERLCSAGQVIVSGLARGCDSVAHRTALDTGGRTIAVLAHGLDYCYPPENRPLAQEILDTGGLLVCEYPPGTRPRRHYFVVRDRLQSGFSKALCVIESDLVGGTMHTVRFAQKQQRRIACLALETPGNKHLIAERGAVPLDSERAVAQFIDSIQEY
ncbi:DNA-processing protein DprA [Breznakiellaceae bacterium SP9]